MSKDVYCCLRSSEKWAEIVRDYERLSEFVNDWPRWSEIVKGGQHLSKMVRDCLKCSRIAKRGQRLLEGVSDCLGFLDIVKRCRDFPRWSEILWSGIVKEGQRLSLVV